MTEEEAKTKWCPFVRYAADTEPASNRWPKSDGPKSFCNCLASSCMAWRTRERYRDSETVEGIQKPAGDGWEPNVGHPGWYRSFYDLDGYCGLAGQPS